MVDDHCRTSDPSIYAAGDCTRFPGRKDRCGWRIGGMRRSTARSPAVTPRAATPPTTPRRRSGPSSSTCTSKASAGRPRSPAQRVRRPLGAGAALVFELGRPVDRLRGRHQRPARYRDGPPADRAAHSGDGCRSRRSGQAVGADAQGQGLTRTHVPEFTAMALRRCQFGTARSNSPGCGRGVTNSAGVPANASRCVRFCCVALRNECVMKMLVLSGVACAVLAVGPALAADLALRPIERTPKSVYAMPRPTLHRAPGATVRARRGNLCWVETGTFWRSGSWQPCRRSYTARAVRAGPLRRARRNAGFGRLGIWKRRQRRPAPPARPGSNTGRRACPTRRRRLCCAVSMPRWRAARSRLARRQAGARCQLTPAPRRST